MRRRCGGAVMRWLESSEYRRLIYHMTGERGSTYAIPPQGFRYGVHCVPFSVRRVLQ